MAACSSSAVVSIPEGRWLLDNDNEDAKWLTVFPAEIWETIVNSVTDPAVMYNMAKASPFLERFLESQRSIYLLHEVLKIRDVGHQSTGLQRWKPNLYDYLGTNELLKCRRVCCLCVRGFSGRFMECNIWELMVNLKQVDLKTGELPMRKYLE